MKNKNHLNGITLIVAILFYPQIYSFEQIAKKSILLYHRLVNPAYKNWYSNVSIFKRGNIIPGTSTLKPLDFLKYPELNDYLNFFDSSKAIPEIRELSSLIIVSGKSRSGKSFLVNNFVQELVNKNNNIKILMPEISSAINTQTIDFVNPTALAFAPCVFVISDLNPHKLMQRNLPEQLNNFLKTMCQPIQAQASRQVLYIIETSDCHLEALKELLVGYQPMIIELQFPNYQERLEHVRNLLISYNIPQDDLADFCAQLTDGLSFSHITYLIDECRVHGHINGAQVNKELIQELYCKKIKPDLQNKYSA